MKKITWCLDCCIPPQYVDDLKSQRTISTHKKSGNAHELALKRHLKYQSVTVTGQEAMGPFSVLLLRTL